MTWKHVPLVDLLEVSVGGVWGAPAGDDELDVRVWRVTELKSGGRLEPDTAARRSVSRRQFSNRSLLPGDLLLEKSGGGPKTPVGRVGLVRAVPEPSVCSNFMQLLRPDVALVEPRYLHLFLNHFHDAGCTEPMQTASTNIRNIKASNYVRIEVPLPPLDEQRRIVAILEDHLSHLDAAEASLRDVVVKSDAARWRYLTDRVLNAGGSAAPLGSLGSVKNGIYVSRPGIEEDGVPILRIGAVRPLQLDLSDLRYSRLTPVEVDRLDGFVSAGDLLFTRYNGNPELVGACTAVPEDVPEVTYPDKLIRFRLQNDQIIPEYLAIVCSTGLAREEIRSARKTSAGQVGIAGGSLKRIMVQIPSKKYQEQILEQAAEYTENLALATESAKTALMRSSRLRRSLLAAAFSGRLTGSDQDMSELSERIGV